MTNASIPASTRCVSWRVSRALPWEIETGTGRRQTLIGLSCLGWKRRENKLKQGHIDDRLSSIRRLCYSKAKSGKQSDKEATF